MLCALAACYSPIPDDGQPCVQQSECPTGQFCVRGRCSISSDGGLIGPNDRDGDGVIDDNDNCPTVPNTEQPNEDGDTEGDACDRCPLIAGEPATGACNTAQPTQSEQYVFESFAKDPKWTPADSAQTAWAVQSGQLVAAATDLATARIKLPSHTGARTFDDFTLTAHFTVDARTPATTSRLGITAVLPAQTLDCGLTTDTTRGDLLALGAMDTAFAWAPPKTLELSLASHAGTFTCTIRAGSAAPTTVTLAAVANPTGDDAFRLFAQQVTAHVDWVYMLGSPAK